jgi:type IV secretory pathway VirB4 component
MDPIKEDLEAFKKKLSKKDKNKAATSDNFEVMCISKEKLDKKTNELRNSSNNLEKEHINYAPTMLVEELKKKIVDKREELTLTESLITENKSLKQGNEEVFAKKEATEL